jgi:hypothetical protein
MEEDTNDTYAVVDLDELYDEDRAKFNEALEDYARLKSDYWFYVNSRGGAGVLYVDNCPEEPFYTFLHVTTVR